MSSNATLAADNGTGQQTIYESLNALQIHQPVRGVKVRVDLSKHEEWLKNNQAITNPVINFSEAYKIKERDGDLTQVLEPWHLPILLGTEHDNIVDERSLQEILDLLEVAQPLIYVPDVGRNYQHMDEEKQMNEVEAYIHHVRTFNEKYSTRISTSD